MPEAHDAEDPLAALREHVRNAQRAAERLAGDSPAQEQGNSPQDQPHAARGAERTPPSGWAAPEAAHEAQRELRALSELVESLRALLPDELREQLNELLRQILLLLRAIIDWLVTRIDRDAGAPAVEVRDIPIS
jgi:hypothetical protein